MNALLRLFAWARIRAHDIHLADVEAEMRRIDLTADDFRELMNDRAYTLKLKAQAQQDYDATLKPVRRYARQH